MNRTASAISLFLWSAALQAQLELKERVLGDNYLTRVSPAAFEKAPKWKDSDEHPPVSARKAIKLATSALESSIDTPKGWKWEISEAALKSFRGNWYWQVTFESRRREGDGQFASTKLRIVVLMDGNAVKPMLCVPFADFEGMRP